MKWKACQLWAKYDKKLMICKWCVVTRTRELFNQITNQGPR